MPTQEVWNCKNVPEEKKMRLQDILVDYRKNEKIKELYYKCSGSVKETQGTLLLQKGATLSFGTYFNSFSLEKWRKYTNTNQYGIIWKGSGKVKISLQHSYIQQGQAITKTITEQEVFLQEEPVLEIPNHLTQGICYPVLEALEEQVTLENAGYEGQCMEKVREDVFLALDICTFKREPYVERNIKELSQCILDNPKSPLYGRTQVFISDNGCSLGQRLAEVSKVKVMPNENVGGVGGFTRGMVEAMKDEKFTHILIMDDDAVIEPSAIVKTYTFLTTLKEEYKEYTIGGGLLRENTPWIQYESGAVWKRGKIKAGKHHFDLTKLECILENEIEEEIEYAGWWFSCIPVSQIKTYGLPLPLFIHRDDIEYGIRTGRGRFIFLNGVAVWHEAFENKMPGATEYYDWRNLAIVNCIHYPDYNRKELFRFLVKWVAANVIRYRYRYVEMNLLGIEDFLRGIDWLKAQDATKLHQNICSMNYKAVPAREYVGYKGIKEEDIQWERIEKVEARSISKWEKLFRQMTFNGYLLPSKKGSVLLAMPHDNIYDMYRQKEILYVDSNGNAVLLQRSLKEAFGCFQKLWRIKKLLHSDFEKRRKEYAARYTELTQEEFWKGYLKMDKGELHGQGNR